MADKWRLMVKMRSRDYSKAAGKIKDAITNLLAATVEDDGEEAEILIKAENGKAALVNDSVDVISSPSPSESDKEALDPFGLDTLLLPAGKKNEKRKGVTVLSKKVEEEEYKRFIKAQREVLLLCLEIAARHYKVPWCQTGLQSMLLTTVTDSRCGKERRLKNFGSP